MASGPERFLAATVHLPISPQRMPDSTHTAAEAAAAVGCQVGAIVKSLVFVAVTDSEREPLLALVCGDGVLWKPSIKAPLTAIATHRICDAVMQAHGHPDVLGFFQKKAVLPTSPGCPTTSWPFLRAPLPFSSSASALSASA